MLVHGSGFCEEFGQDHFRTILLAPQPVLEEAYDKLESFLGRHRQRSSVLSHQSQRPRCRSYLSRRGLHDMSGSTAYPSVSLGHNLPPLAELSIIYMNMT